MQAIRAWNRALEAEPDNAEVLLSMGVSYTNELDQGRALSFLRRWLERRLAQSGVRLRWGWGRAEGTLLVVRASIRAESDAPLARAPPGAERGVHSRAWG